MLQRGILQASFQRIESAVKVIGEALIVEQLAIIYSHPGMMLCSEEISGT
jgi:hypothetical protein